MFGFFFVLAFCICKLISWGINTHQNNYCRNYLGDDFTYTDINRVRRLKSNNKIVRRIKMGDHYIVTDKHYRTLFDETEAKVLREACEHPGELVYYDKKKMIDDKHIARFAKWENNAVKYYAVVSYADANFVCDLETYTMTAPTSQQIEVEKLCREKGLLNYTPKGFACVIKEFNDWNENERRGYIRDHAMPTLKQEFLIKYLDFYRDPQKAEKHSWIH